MRRTMISLLGFQPAAAACALLTWVREREPPDELLLLLTRARQDAHAARVIEALAHQLGVNCRLVGVSTALSGSPEGPSPVDVAREAADDGNVIFAADPGLKFLIVAMARAIGDRGTYLYGDGEFLNAVTYSGSLEAVERLRLANLGFDTLMNLHGLTAAATDAEPDFISRIKIVIPDRIRKGVTIAREDGTACATFELAYERKGRLIALKSVSGSTEEARTLQRVPREMMGLQPAITAISSDYPTCERLKSAGIFAIHESNRAAADLLSRWMRGPITLPGMAIVKSLGVPLDVTYLGAGGNGEPMAIWVGPDLLPTLNAIITHHPRQLFLLFDGTSPATVQRAGRVCQAASSLPVGAIRCIRSDALGTGVQRQMKSLVDVDPRMVLHVTPGKQAQGVALGRLPGVPWTMVRTPAGYVSAPLGQESPRLPVSSPDLVTLLRCVNGSLVSDGDDVRAWPEEMVETYALLALALSERLGSGRRLRLVPLQPFEAAGVKVRFSPGMVHVERDGTVYQAPFGRKGGFWFEGVVAALLRRAGACDVRVGMRVQWPTLRAKPYPDGTIRFKDDIDVVARLHDALFAVSCKTGQSTPMSKDARETAAVAEQSIGRFAIPLLVRPVLPPEAARYRDATTGAAALAIAELVDADNLAMRLTALARVRSTIAAPV